MAEEKHYNAQGKLVSSLIPADKSAEDVAKGTFGARARAADLAKAPNFRSKAGPKRADYPMTNAGGDQFNLDKAAYDAEQDRLAAQRAALSKP